MGSTTQEADAKNIPNPIATARTPAIKSPAKIQTISHLRPRKKNASPPGTPAAPASKLPKKAPPINIMWEVLLAAPEPFAMRVAIISTVPTITKAPIQQTMNRIPAKQSQTGNFAPCETGTSGDWLRLGSVMRPTII